MAWLIDYISEGMRYMTTLEITLFAIQAALIVVFIFLKLILAYFSVRGFK